jgi:hypothetical protein
MGALLTPRKLVLDKGEPKARTNFEDRFERIRLGTFQKHGRFLKGFDLS